MIKYSQYSLLFALLIIVGQTACSAQSPSVPREADHRTYEKRLQDLETQRQQLGGESSPQKIKQARNILYKALKEDIYPAWYGTPWDFNGITQTPGKGQIACGYFVTTTLRDAGFRLPRVKLAQQAASKIIYTLCEPGSIKSYRNWERFNAYLDGYGKPGIFILGLDNHVGFVLIEGGKKWFVNADYTGKGVVSDPFNESGPLKSSGLWMIGDLLGNDAILKAWLRQTNIAMK